ncbi:unnamed protein product [Urochloa decumbens]|uniref:Uncharacterized protein n=1 Tax=Urochloa decumbens TaxID=240449 RepID=A0ABC9BC41_9POAL
MAAALGQAPGTRTASRCAPETVQGTHAFEIARHSLHKGMGAGRFLRSAAFAVGGHQWCIRYYPDGDVLEECRGYVSVYLELLSKRSEVRAFFEFKMYNHLTKSSTTILHTKAAVLFSTMDASKSSSSFGSPKFMMSGILEVQYLRDDDIVIECDISVIKPPLVGKTTMASEFELVGKTTMSSDFELLRRMLPSDLSSNFRNLLETKEGADVTFMVGGEAFPAHRIVLAARSAVFKAELFGPVGADDRDHITVEEMQPVIFKALLHFIYADTFPRAIMNDFCGDDAREFTKHLLVAADRYAMGRLKLICENFLCRNLDVETVAVTLSLADQHNCTKLKDACIEYMNSSNKISDVIASQGGFCMPARALYFSSMEEYMLWYVRVDLTWM